MKRDIGRDLRDAFAQATEATREFSTALTFAFADDPFDDLGRADPTLLRASAAKDWGDEEFAVLVANHRGSLPRA